MSQTATELKVAKEVLQLDFKPHLRVNRLEMNCKEMLHELRMKSGDSWDQLGAKAAQRATTQLQRVCKCVVMCRFKGGIYLPAEVFGPVSDSSHVLYPTITLTQMELREGKKKGKKHSNLSTVRGGFQPRGPDSANSSNIDFLPRRLPSQEVRLCALDLGEVCVV